MDKNIVEKLAKDYILGDGLEKISKKHNLPKSTIYYNLSNLNIIRKQNRIKELNNTNKILIGTFIGLWAGDGSKFIDRGKYTIKIHFHKDNSNFELFTKI